MVTILWVWCPSGHLLHAMEQSTKSKILLTALRMFALYGYEGTNLRDLASELGLSKSALYKHYKSKEDIWDSTMEYMKGYFAERSPLKDHEVAIPNNEEEFISLLEKVLTFSMKDENLILGRRILAAEMFRAGEGKLPSNPYILEIKAKFELLLQKMMDEGVIKEDDPGFIALLFVSPITDMIRAADHEKDKDIYLEKALDFARCFFERIKKS